MDTILLVFSYLNDIVYFQNKSKLWDDAVGIREEIQGDGIMGDDAVEYSSHCVSYVLLLGQ